MLGINPKCKVCWVRLRECLRTLLSGVCVSASLSLCVRARARTSNRALARCVFFFLSMECVCWRQTYRQRRSHTSAPHACIHQSLGRGWTSRSIITSEEHSLTDANPRQERARQTQRERDPLQNQLKPNYALSSFTGLLCIGDTTVCVCASGCICLYPLVCAYVCMPVCRCVFVGTC